MNAIIIGEPKNRATVYAEWLDETELEGFVCPLVLGEIKTDNDIGIMFVNEDWSETKTVKYTDLINDSSLYRLQFVKEIRNKK